MPLKISISPSLFVIYVLFEYFYIFIFGYAYSIIYVLFEYFYIFIFCYVYSSSFFVIDYSIFNSSLFCKPSERFKSHFI